MQKSALLPDMNILLIGTGPMAITYARVLNAMEKEYVVVGRGGTSAAAFKAETGVTPIEGGIEAFLQQHIIDKETKVIIAIGSEVLMPVLLMLLNHDIKNILVEKPAAISIEELLQNEAAFHYFSESIFVAYNRRFYASVEAVREIIAADGGLQSMHFEFTEWSNVISGLQKYPGVKENWFFANSTHVIDLAFHLSGFPVDWNAYSKKGSLDWHRNVIYAGAGVTEKGVLFSYSSNWESAGRWSLELLTSQRRIYLRPMEEISVQEKGTLVIAPYTIDYSIDKQFKPGLYKQVEAFLNNISSNLCSLTEHLKNTKFIYSKINK